MTDDLPKLTPAQKVFADALEAELTKRWGGKQFTDEVQREVADYLADVAAATLPTIQIRVEKEADGRISVYLPADVADVFKAMAGPAKG